MTLTRLAELSGFSIGTVSKAFSGSREISDATRERVFGLAKELGCFDKFYKDVRVRPLIGLLFPEPESEYYGREIGILERALNDRGADVIISFTRFDPEQAARMFREFAYRMKVDGIILSGSGEMIRNSDELPLIVITNAGQTAQNADAVRIDSSKGIKELIETVKKYGHSNVGFIGEKLTNVKEMKFRQAMRLVGLPVYDKYISISEERFAKAGEDGMRRLIERGAIPSVIIAAYDQIAYGAMRCAKECGYRIPDDISFVGMDDISATSYLDVPLSSIHINLEDVCSQVVDLLFKRIENRHYRSRREITVPTTVKIRESLKDITNK